MASTSGVYDDEDEATGMVTGPEFGGDVEEEMMRREMVKAMSMGWESVVELYRRDPRSHRIKIGVLRSTALHYAISCLEDDAAEQLVQLIRENNNNPLDVLSISNKDGDNPLHLAASYGSVRLCKSIIGDNDDDGYKQLLATRNNLSETPLVVAAMYGEKEAFFWLYGMCDTDDQALEYSHDRNGISALHLAIGKGHWDLAFQIIHRDDRFVDSFPDSDKYSGITPLHQLATHPRAFKSGIRLNFFKNIVYHCIHVEELVPSTFEEEEELLPLSAYPSNCNTCIQFCRLLSKVMKSTVSMISRKSGQLSCKQLDVENHEEEQGTTEPHGQALEKGSQGHQGLLPSRCGRFFKFIVFSASKILMVMVFRVIMGAREMRKLKEEKEIHTWSLQIMNLLIDGAKKSTYEMNPQNLERRERKYCHSEYEYFRRGRAKSTPIILAGANGVKEIVERILKEFPLTIYDRNNLGRDLMMVAAGEKQSHVYDFLRTTNLIGEKWLLFRGVDTYGATALHLTAMLDNSFGWVVPTGLLKMQWEMKWYEYVKDSLSPNPYFRRDEKGRYPYEIFREEHEELLRESKEWVNTTCNSCSFIAALIATVVFTSSATVPGGLVQETGVPIFQHHLAFQLFSVSSLVALSTSFVSLLIFLTLLTTNYQYQDFSKRLPQTLIFGLTSLFTSMAAMLICFCSGHFLMLEHRFKYALIPVYAFTCLAISYFGLQKFPSYFLLLKATFSKVPQRIYREDDL